MNAIDRYVYQTALINADALRNNLDHIDEQLGSEFFWRHNDDKVHDLVDRRVEQRSRLRIAQAAVREFEMLEVSEMSVGEVRSYLTTLGLDVDAFEKRLLERIARFRKESSTHD